VAPSLTRGRFCKLLVYVLLGLASALTRRSKSRRSCGLIFLSELILISRSVSCYDSLGHRGIILTIVHTGHHEATPIGFIKPHIINQQWELTFQHLGSIHWWAHLNLFYLKTDTFLSRQVVFLIKGQMDNVLNCDSCINIPSPHTYR
jgi:hypothetical protein